MSRVLNLTFRFITQTTSERTAASHLTTIRNYRNTLSTMTDGPFAKKTRPSGPIIGTHSGTFHCDEVLACFMLRQLPEYENSYILRSRIEPMLRDECAIIVDVGGLFEPEKLYFDHHQKSFGETFSSLRPEFGDEYQIRLSSAGLVYVYYGEKVIAAILKRERNIQLSPENLKLVYLQVYRNFISEIDAIDNGVSMYEGDVGKPVYKISTNLSARIGKLNPAWDDDVLEGQLPEDKEWQRFELAMLAAGKEFVDNVVQLGCSWVNAREFVREALLGAKSVHASGEILLLPRFCPWKSHLADLEKEYGIKGLPKLVIFKEKERSWRVAGVPVSPDSFLGRQFLPAPWRGLRDQDLETAVGVKDLVFVHHTGFIGGAYTEQAALAMAIKSIEWTV